MKKQSLSFLFLLSFCIISAQNFSVKTDPVYIKLESTPPNIELINPIQLNMVSTNKIQTLKFSVTSESNISDIKVTNNDIPVNISRGAKASGVNGQTEVIEQQMYLAQGMNNFKIVASNEDGGIAESIVSINFEVVPPEVEWINPKKENLVSAAKTMILKFAVTSPSKVSNVLITQNGNEVEMSRGMNVSGGSSTRKVIEQQVNLEPGLNEFKLVVENEYGGVAELASTVSYNIEVTDRTDYALIFAVNDYEEWNDLINPVFDATAINQELQDSYGFKTELILNPGKTEILQKLREYAGKSYKEKDQLMIFFAGHGRFDEITRMGYLATKDSKLNDMVGETYISHSALRDYIDNIPVQHIFVGLDACFGGTFDQMLAMAGSRGGDAMMYELTQTEFIERKLKYKTRKYLTSGGKEYVPDGRAGQHSPFARKMLEALRNYGGNDRILTWTELLTYFEALNPQPRSGEFGSNAPGSDFIFVAK